MRGSKEKKFLAATMILVVVACLLMAEAGIRIYHLTCDRQRFIWLPDEFLAYVHSANNTFQHHYKEKEKITVEHRTNAFGFLGEDIPLKKEEGTFRVLVLGDSFSEALQVSEDKNFCGRLKRLLNELPDKQYKRVEVINTGVSGYSPLNYYLYFKRELARFKPDLVVVQLFANDVFEDNTARAKSVLDQDELPLKTHRYFVKKYFDHRLVTRESFNDHPLWYRVQRFLIEKSRAFEYFYVKFYNRTKPSAFNQKMIREDQYGTGWQFFILDPKHKLSLDTVFKEKAWGYTQKYLLALKSEVEKQNARFMMFYVPMEVQLKLDRYGTHASLYIGRHMGTTFNDMLSVFSRENDISFLDLLDDFENNKDQRLYLDRDGHLTEAGHKVASSALSRYIMDKALLKK